MCTISTNLSSKIIIRHIKYKLNEQQCIHMGNPARCQAVNNDYPVRCINPPWEERTRRTPAAAYLSVMRRTPRALSRRELKTPYLMKGKYRENGNSVSAWVYNFIPVAISIIYFLLSYIFLSL